MRPTSPAYREEEARAERRRAAFAERHGVRLYRNSRHHVAMILHSGGSPPHLVRPVLDRVGMFGAYGGPFDHGEVWGRDGRPTLLVGHPYSLPEEDRALLAAIAALGVEVRTDGESYYGYGTSQVLVSAHAPDMGKRSCPSPRQWDAGALEAARIDGYVVVQSVRHRAGGLYYDWCRRHNRPFIKVRRFRTRAAIRLDMDTCNWQLPCGPDGNLDDSTRRTIEALFQSLLRSDRQGRVLGVPGPRGVSLLYVPYLQAPDAAKELYRLAMQCRPAGALTSSLAEDPAP